MTGLFVIIISMLLFLSGLDGHIASNNFFNQAGEKAITGEEIVSTVLNSAFSKHF